MLYRKRAWDIMRSEFPRAKEDAPLSEAMKAIEQSLGQYPDNDFLVVTTKEGSLVGVISMWNIFQAMGPELLKKMTRIKDDENYEKAFKLACQLGAQTGIRKIIQKDFPRIRPSDTLDRIMEVFLDYNRGCAVVEEGGKIFGIVILADVYKEIASNV